MRLHTSTRRRVAVARGFTLIELMVAMMAGIIVAIAAFSFSKQSTRFFSQEARLSASQMPVLAGFQRLQGDLARAALMSTPNANRDRDLGRLCGWATWPQTLQGLNMTGVRVTVGGSQLGTGVTQLPDTNYPDSVRIIGNLTNADDYIVRDIDASASGTGDDVYLAVATGAFRRSGIVDTASLTAIFRPGRLLRLRVEDTTMFAIIAGGSYDGIDKAIITTRDPMPVKSGAGCGRKIPCKNCVVNVVNIVDYGLSRPNTVAYNNTIYSTEATALGDNTRTELVRREVFLDQPMVPYYQDPALEVVAEYVVDLRFAAWVSNPGQAGLTYVPQSSAALTARMTPAASYTIGSPAQGPESIRSLEVRLVVRSREFDRSADVVGAGDGGLMYRYQSAAGFARTRTLMADVSLPNQRGEAW